MARRSTRIAIVLASLLTVFSAGAQAQERTAREPLVFGTGATYAVTFDDDPLAAIGPGTIIPKITVIGRFQHAQLMRPRTQFVVEMLKSPEGL